MAASRIPTPTGGEARRERGARATGARTAATRPATAGTVARTTRRLLALHRAPAPVIHTPPLVHTRVTRQLAHCISVH